MSQKTTQAGRIQSALSDIAKTRSQADTPLNDGRKGSLEQLDQASGKLQPLLSQVAQANDTLDAALNLNVNNALIFANATITTVLQYGIFTVDNSVASAIGQSIKGWVTDPTQNLQDFQPLGQFISDTSKKVRDNVLQPLWDFLKNPVYALLALAGIVAAFLLYVNFRKVS